MNSPQKADSHLIFLVCLGFFGFIHWLMYVFWWPMQVLLSTHLIGLAGVVLLFKPRSTVALITIVIAMAVDGWIQAPVYSNHTILKNLMVLGMLVAGLETLIRRRDVDWFLLRFAPYGALILIGMYFFGIFHKINSGFLDSDVSCAIALWQDMPIPQMMKASPTWHVAGIVGTFVIEGLIALSLLIPRTRHLGVFAGVGFHMLLASSGYEFYATFSILTITLHTLFLNPRLHGGLLRDDRFQRMLRWSRSTIGWVIVSAYLALIAFATIGQQPVHVGLLCWGFVLPLLWVIWTHGRGQSRLFDRAVLRSGWIPALVILFYLNGFSPYLGMKTAQSFNMFANLRLEGEVSNHLIFSTPPGGYLDDVVAIDESRGVGWFTYIQNEGLQLVYYDFLNHMERAGPGSSVTYTLNGVRYESRTYEDLIDEFDRVLHPRWVRKWFHFIPVDPSTPKPCATDR